MENKIASIRELLEEAALEFVILIPRLFYEVALGIPRGSHTMELTVLIGDDHLGCPIGIECLHFPLELSIVIEP